MSGGEDTPGIDLANERVGGRALYCNDEFFAQKENLLRAGPAVWKEDEYTDNGKWMDGWETRRRREPGHDWCIIRLGLPGRVREVVVDTAFFRGNYPEHCSIEAAAVAGHPNLEGLTAPEVEWIEILPKSPLKGDSKNRFGIDSPYRFTHLRLRIYPDGGVARLRVYGDVIPDWRQLARAGDRVDLAAADMGGLVTACSDMFFGPRNNLIMPGFARTMGEGWETRRRRGPGNDWVIVELATEGHIERVEVDTTHFKGNAPGACSIEVCRVRDAGPEGPGNDAAWTVLLPKTPTLPHTRHFFEEELQAAPAATHARLQVYPDGGVARWRVWGRPTPAGWVAAGLRRLNALLPAAARSNLHECCGSTKWAAAVAESRPFADWESLIGAADKAFEGLEPADWQEAFSHHPRIGERVGQKAQSTAAQGWSDREQAGTKQADSAILAALAEKNRAYEARFGQVYLVCATGLSAEELLAKLESRLNNDPAQEARIAADEQRKIARLRLRKLLGPA